MHDGTPAGPPATSPTTSPPEADSDPQRTVWRGPYRRAVVAYDGEWHGGPRRKITFDRRPPLAPPRVSTLPLRVPFAPPAPPAPSLTQLLAAPRPRAARPVPGLAPPDDGWRPPDGAALKALRERAGLSQRGAAAATGIERGMVCDLERGKRTRGRGIADATLRAYAAALEALPPAGPPAPRWCGECGVPIDPGAYRTRIWCSDRCQDRGNRRQQRARRLTPPAEPGP